jgi:aminoglycoside phosphotransferase (APT) family kinase protein
VNRDLPGLDAAALERWLRSTVPSAVQDGPWTAELISGGLSNITYRLRLPGGGFILRRPPLGPVLPRAHDMAREHRVITALHGTAVPVPGALALCEDRSVLGAPFYVMSEVDGVVFRAAEDTEALTTQTRAALAELLIQALADLHAVDPDDVGLGDFGRREGYCSRQIKTWGGQWQRSKTRELPDMDRLIARLADRVPPDSGNGVVHGDYRLDNVIFDVRDQPRLAAVLDWELATLGDPLADLGLMLTYWHDLGDDERAAIPVGSGLTALPGFPTASEVATRYSAITGRDISDLPFYVALGTLKLAIILEGVHARYLGGQTVGDGYAEVGRAVPALVASALALLAELG